ncbi:MAG TPA: HAD-IB family phosphatase [Methanocellales archaeon]|nr:HAD-IB family phosphatase [Methanocellales archaeon]
MLYKKVSDSAPYKLIILDMDGTLLDGRTIYALAAELDFEEHLRKIITSNLQEFEKTIEIAKLLRGLSVAHFLEIFDRIPLRAGIEKVIVAAKKAGMMTVIATDSYQLAANRLAERLGIDRAFANELEVRGKEITGKIKLNNDILEPRVAGCKIHSVCKRDILHKLCDELKITPAEIVAVGDSSNDKCMIKTAGLGITFESSTEINEFADIILNDDLSKMLDYIL